MSNHCCNENGEESQRNDITLFHSRSDLEWFTLVIVGEDYAVHVTMKELQDMYFGIEAVRDMSLVVGAVISIVPRDGLWRSFVRDRTTIFESKRMEKKYVEKKNSNQCLIHHPEQLVLNVERRFKQKSVSLGISGSTNQTDSSKQNKIIILELGT